MSAELSDDRRKITVEIERAEPFDEEWERVTILPERSALLLATAVNVSAALALALAAVLMLIGGPVGFGIGLGGMLAALALFFYRSR